MDNKMKNNNSNFTILAAVVITIAGIGLWQLKKHSNNDFWYKDIEHKSDENKTGLKLEKNSNDSDSNIFSNQQSQDFFPESKGEIVNHKFYSLSYIERWEQPEWVAYKLTKKQLQLPNVKRTDWFNEDPHVSTGSAKHFQYKGTGFTRGHLAPAGDMSFDQTAMEESFFMSNMSPQPRSFNNGIWRELEEQTRDWVYQNSELYIVSGPVVTKNEFFKKHKIAIPDSFYKVLLDLDGNEKKGIAFLIPNQLSNEPLEKYALSIQELEKKTGINFFKGFDKKKVGEFENSYSLEQWPISKSRYNLRVSRWNND
jgi:endonuclease G, mitochondrial